MIEFSYPNNSSKNASSSSVRAAAVTLDPRPAPPLPAPPARWISPADRPAHRRRRRSRGRGIRGPARVLARSASSRRPRPWSRRARAGGLGPVGSEPCGYPRTRWRRTPGSRLVPPGSGSGSFVAGFKLRSLAQGLGVLPREPQQLRQGQLAQLPNQPVRVHAQLVPAEPRAPAPQGALQLPEVVDGPRGIHVRGHVLPG